MLPIFFVLFLSSFVSITCWEIAPASKICRFKCSLMYMSSSNDENTRINLKRLQAIAAGLLAATNLGAP